MSDVESAAVRLTPRQLLFVEHYYENANPTAAADWAGYAKPGPSAAELLKNPKIQRALAKMAAPVRVAAAIEVETVVAELGHVAFADVGDVFDEEGQVLPLKDWPEYLRRCVASFEVDQFGLPTKVRFWSKNDALDKLMRYLGAYQDSITVKHDLEAIERAINAGRDRLANLRTIEGEATEVKRVKKSKKR